MVNSLQLVWVHGTVVIHLSITGHHGEQPPAGVLDKYMGQLLFIYVSITGPHGEQPPAGVEWPPILNKYMTQLFFKEMSIQVPGP